MGGKSGKKRQEPGMPEPEPQPQPAAGTSSATAPGLSLEGSANAPFIYFENAGVFGHMNGIIRVTLEAGRILPGVNNTAYADRVVVGHLRMNIQAAQELRNALDRALLIAARPGSQTVN